MRRLLVALTLLLSLGSVVAGCGGADEAPAAVSPGTVVIDVRTPQEYASGHLDGALNVDLSAEDFDTRLGELDPDGEYVVYCRTGNRSAEAASRMRDLGFTDVTDAGGLEQAATSTGLDVVAE